MQFGSTFLARPVMGAFMFAAVAGIGACTDALSARNDDQPATVSFRVPAANSASGAALALVPITANGHTIDVQSVDVVFDEVTFERWNATGGDADSDDSDADSDSEGGHNRKIRVGASTVSLPLQGGTITPFTGTLPAGTYDRLELDAEYMRVRGTYDGQAFDVTLPVNAEYELALDPPLVVAENSQPANVTVNIDVLSWFRAADGSVIDPRRLQTDAAYRSAFVRQIRASLRATEDSDKDGDDVDSDSDSR